MGLVPSRMCARFLKLRTSSPQPTPLLCPLRKAVKRSPLTYSSSSFSLALPSLTRLTLFTGTSSQRTSSWTTRRRHFASSTTGQRHPLGTGETERGMKDGWSEATAKATYCLPAQLITLLALASLVVGGLDSIPLGSALPDSIPTRLRYLRFLQLPRLSSTSRTPL